MTLILPNGEISKEVQQPNYPAVFNTAFRPFFWLGALFSVLSISVWAFSFGGDIQLTLYGGSLNWHIHEMLFGFFPAIMSGFLLTAVQTWTKQPCIKGWILAVLTLLWAAGRITVVFPELLPTYLIAIVDSLFLPTAAIFLARPILKAKMWRNLFFVPIMIFMGCLNGLFHLSIHGFVDIAPSEIAQTMIIAAALVMSIMGGRVFPMFTANGTKTQRVLAISWLEWTSVLSIALSVLLSLTTGGVPTAVVASVYLIAGLSNFMRGVRWRIWVTLRAPLVWSLHISYLAMSTGLILLALAEAGVLLNASIAYHTITVGGMGGMILSMISRISLGHTGRFIESNRLITMSLISITLAFLVRTVGPSILTDYEVVIYVSAALWAFGYGTFVVNYAPILLKKRADGMLG